MMKKFISIACVALLALGHVHAANNITISFCSARHMLFTWTVDNLETTGLITARDTNNAANTFIIPLGDTSGNYAGDIAGAWSGSNENIELFLTAASSVSATCPGD